MQSAQTVITVNGRKRSVLVRMGFAAMSNMRKHPLEVCFVNGARAWENAHNSKIVGLLR